MPGGSSSGSAVAVAAGWRQRDRHRDLGLAVVAGELNGVVTVKSTIGLISRAGIIPIAHSQVPPAH